ncbi:MAG: transcriptional repressor LexA [Chloroflexota bacterium]|nr:transcriptional repressor LexA [Chloroflexota bacterium]MDE2958587.1 transcriptional repressor LexA [Chloroflexota bacterium]
MPPKKNLRPRQQQILDFIEHFLDENGIPPTVRDIQRGCSISSTSVVDYNLRLMERDGYLKRRSEVARGIELLDETGLPVANGAARVQIVGSIAAGEPIPAFSSEGVGSAAEFDIVEVRPDLKKRHGTLYALSVKGTSMIDALIDDGDVVVIKPTNTARNGEMVVAWLKEEEEATLKKFFREGDQVRLQPANSTMDPIYVSADNVEVKGRVVEVLRQF